MRVSRELWYAWLVAIAADAIQILLLPLFAFGGFSPTDTIIDLAVAVMLCRLIGWHWAFLPTMLAELLPGFDLFPTWTAAVAYVTWQRWRSSRFDIEIEPVKRLAEDEYAKYSPGTRAAPGGPSR
jgi:hypothetical protein